MPAVLQGLRRPAGRPLLLVGLLWVALVAHQLAGGGDPALALRQGLLAATLAGAVLSWAAGSRGTPRARRAWRWLATGWTVLALPQLAFVAADIAGTPPGWLPAVIQVCKAFWAPLILTGLLCFPMRPLSGREGFKFGADIVTVIGGGFMLTWYFLIGPTLARGDSGIQALIGIAYPLGDLALVFGICALLLRGGIGSVRHPLSLLLIGLTLFLAADLFASYEALHGGVDLTTTGWRTGPGVLLVSALLLPAGAAAAHLADPRPRQAQAGDRAHRAAAQLPYLALAVGYTMLLIAAAAETDVFPWAGLVAGVIVMTGAVAARQFIAMRENHALVVSDALTGLANRVRLQTSLDAAVLRHQQHGVTSAMLLIDLDGFKQVNDQRGHEVGDQLLIGFAGILMRCVRQSDTAGRLGGDEFAVVLHRVGDPAQAQLVAQRILDAAAQDIVIDGVKARIGCSIGIAMTTAEDPPHVIRHRADMAMYQAKRRSGHSCELYTEGFEDAVAAENAMAEEIAAAASAGQLRVLYQPIVTLATGELAAVEALVRWQHPLRGTVLPDQFIPLAEATGAIQHLGLHVLEEACRQVKAWQRLPGRQGLRASVNLSPRQLEQDDLVPAVTGILRRTGLDPRDLVLELTESALVGDSSGVARLEALRELGIRIALDDFGTGYSSLRYLTRLPVDILKLDRCFVAELNGAAEGSAVAEAVIRLSQILHLDIVAEGIETQAQATELTLLGCRTGQGYHYARPMAAGDLEELIHTRLSLRAAT